MVRDSTTTGSRREVWRLGILFGALYFIQGVAEPTEGLVAQPVSSLRLSAGDSTSAVTLFAALMAVPWCFKPLYGLCSDFVPWLGLRRKNYLAATSALAAAAFLLLGFAPEGFATSGMLLVLLLVPTTAVAWSDVVVDALMVEKSQPLGLTGRMQSIQWSAMWGAAILCGYLGGALSQADREHFAFAGCGLLMLVMCGLALVAVREEKQSGPRATFREDLRELRRAFGTKGVRFSCLFLFLWSLNPVTNTLVYTYAVGPLAVGKDAFGTSASLMAVGALVASAAYGVYCRAFSMRTLLHAAILCGIVATLVYAAATGARSLAVVSLAVGFFHMSGTMAQLDLAARSCPTRVAGTVFATLMAISNLSTILATAAGGWLYDACKAPWGDRGALGLLIAVGVLVTAMCWLLMPRLPTELESTRAIEA